MTSELKERLYTLRNKSKLIPNKLMIYAFMSILIISTFFSYYKFNSAVKNEREAIEKLEESQVNFQELNSKYEDLKATDQVKRNDDLEDKLNKVQETFIKAVSVYENLIDFKISNDNTSEEDILFAESLSFLSKAEYENAQGKLDELQTAIAPTPAPTIAPSDVSEAPSAPVNNSPPGAGYSRQTVATDVGSFTVSIIAADISSTRVIVDTASSGDCANDCPVLPLSTYVARNGAYAGINGSYFCPASYPSCAGKTNSFDTLLMNKDKVYFNSDNNVYSNNPAVIFGSGYVRFVGAASQWGRDTSIDSMISNYPLLVSGGSIVFGGDDDPKKGSKGNRSFVANKGGQVFIGVVHSATVAESARVMHALGMENALNLDNGGSTALWSGGYKLGPGRDLPNVILFVQR